MATWPPWCAPSARVKPDVAWFNLGFASFGDRPLSAILGLLAPAAARWNGVHSHVTLHQLFETVDLEDAAVSSHRLYRAGGWLATHLLLSANSLSVLMPAYRRTLDDKYKRGQVSVRSHGIFAERPEPPDFTRRGNPTHRILAFGKWGTYKRLELLIEAFNRVATKFPNVELVIGGGDHPKTPGYVQSMARLHASDRIRFLGYVPEEAIADLFRDTSLAVMPYTSSAGSSGVAHLAAQYGVPVIASGIQDFRDLAEHEGIAIRFFTPGDLDSLVEQMLLALNSPDDLKEMAWTELRSRGGHEHAAGGAGVHPGLSASSSESRPCKWRLACVAPVNFTGPTTLPAPWARKFRDGRTKTRLPRLLLINNRAR